MVSRAVMPHTTSTALMMGPEQATRRLIWAETFEACPPALLQQLQASDPSIFVCNRGQLQWDESGLLVASFLFTVGKIEVIDNFSNPTSLNNPSQVFTASYNGQQCNFFDNCVARDESTGAISQLPSYGYDCSNVYCGANAMRSCSGVYEEMACPAGTSPPPAIPSYASVTCEKINRGYVQADSAAGNPRFQCTACSPKEENNLLYGFDCNLGCFGCFPSGRCIRIEENNVFGENDMVFERCSTLTDTEDVFCITDILSDYRVDDSAVRPTTAECVAHWNFAPCQCTVCGIDDLGQTITNIDCSEAAGTSSILDSCSGTVTATGVFSFFNEVGFALTADPQNDVCGGDGGSLPPPTAPAPGAAPPTETVEGPSSRPASGAPGGMKGATTLATAIAAAVLLLLQLLWLG